MDGRRVAEDGSTAVLVPFIAGKEEPRHPAAPSQPRIDGNGEVGAGGSVVVAGRKRKEGGEEVDTATPWLLFGWVVVFEMERWLDAFI